MKLLETMYTKITKVINKVLSRFIIPDKQYQNIKDLNVDEIMELKSKYGIGGVILDIDGTIRENFEDVDYRNIKWIIRLKKEFKVCMVSNGRDENIKKLANRIGINYFSHSFKPMKRAFIKASNSMGLDPENVLVIGDEYFADVFGAQRSTMWATSIDQKAFRNKMKCNNKEIENKNKNVQNLNQTINER